MLRKTDYDYFSGTKVLGKEGKVFGVILDYGDMYVSIRRKTKHLFRKYDAWGFDLWVIELLEKRQVGFIGVIEEEDQKVYTVSVETARSKGIVVNMGEDTQVFVPLFLFDQDTYGDNYD